jgi:hypothetical protein
MSITYSSDELEPGLSCAPTFAALVLIVAGWGRSATSAGRVVRWCARWPDVVEVLLDDQRDDGRKDARRDRPRTSAPFSFRRRAVLRADRRGVRVAG